MSVGVTPERGMRGVEAVTRFLDHLGAPYELVEHRETYAAVDEANAVGSELAEMAKTVLLHDHDGFRAAVIPASERLDLHKARERFGASRHLRLASEDEIGQEFPAFDAAALPPVQCPTWDSRDPGHPSARARSCALQRRRSSPRAQDLAARDRTARRAADGRHLSSAPRSLGEGKGPHPSTRRRSNVSHN